MQFRDQIDFVRQHVKKNRMRIFTTILATTMGCAFLIVLASIAFGLQGTLKDEVLSSDSLTRIEVYEGGDHPLDIEKISKLDNISSISESYTMQLDGIQNEATIGANTGYAESSFVNFDALKKAKLPLSKGHYPTTEDGIVVGYNFAQNLLSKEDEKTLEKAKEGEKPKVGIQESVLGKKVLLKWTGKKGTKPVIREFTIEGIGPKPKREWEMNTYLQMSNEAKQSIVTDLKKNFGKAFNEKDMIYKSTAVYATDLEAVPALNKELKAMELSTYTVSQQLEEMNMFFIALKAGLIFVGTIAILIASIGIFNTMTMAVTERTREIGVMKAIGASPKLIQRLFVMESAYIGIIGTAIAVVASYIISFTANWIIPKILYAATEEQSFNSGDIKFSAIPWELVVIASVISIGVAVLSGWRPARKATKIDVIQALRQD